MQRLRRSARTRGTTRSLPRTTRSSRYGRGRSRWAEAREARQQPRGTGPLFFATGDKSRSTRVRASSDGGLGLSRIRWRARSGRPVRFLRLNGSACSPLSDSHPPPSAFISRRGTLAEADSATRMSVSSARFTVRANRSHVRGMPVSARRVTCARERNASLTSSTLAWALFLELLRIA